LEQPQRLRPQNFFFHVGQQRLEQFNRAYAVVQAIGAEAGSVTTQLPATRVFERQLRGSQQANDHFTV
jgi:hypothetical protein